ncbi:MAG: EAL domain-containing protein [Pseudomonadota bacterium]
MHRPVQPVSRFKIASRLVVSQRAARAYLLGGAALHLIGLAMLTVSIILGGVATPMTLATTFVTLVAGLCLMVAAVGVMRKDTRRKQVKAERAYCEVLQQVQRANGFNTIAADLMWETNLTGHVVHLAGRMLDVLQFAHGDMIGRHYLDMIRLEPDQMESMSRAIQALESYSGLVTTFRDRDGADFNFELSARPHFSADGALLGYQGVGTNVTARIAAERKMRELAVRDPLTGIANRYAFKKRLETAFASRDTSTGLTLLAIDLDGFKAINDTHGHDTGDGLLKQVSKRIQSSLREQDWCARLGGDEFMVICDALGNLSDAEKIASRLLDSLSQPYAIDGLGVTIGASIGIAQVPVHGANAIDVVKHADLALYDAKEAGRNRYRAYHVGLGASIDRRKRVEERLREAITHDRLSLVYQPIFSLTSGCVSGFEALARWHDDQLGAVTPDEFIAIAEAAGLIHALGEQVMRKACLLAAEWQAAVPERDTRVCVNVSPAQFRDMNFPHVVESALTESGLHPRHLELEITENLLLVDIEITLRILEELKALGISVAIDDFGAGYSSLGRLHKLPIDRLKIDRSIIEGLATHRDSLSITRAIIQLARNLNISLVAEGIETDEQTRLLRRAGCPEAQGFQLSRPLIGDNTIDLVLAQTRHAA